MGGQRTQAAVVTVAEGAGVTAGGLPQEAVARFRCPAGNHPPRSCRPGGRGSAGAGTAAAPPCTTCVPRPAQLGMRRCGSVAAVQRHYGAAVWATQLVANWEQAGPARVLGCNAAWRRPAPRRGAKAGYLSQPSSEAGKAWTMLHGRAKKTKKPSRKGPLYPLSYRGKKCTPDRVRTCKRRRHRSPGSGAVPCHSPAVPLRQWRHTGRTSDSSQAPAL